MTPPRESRRERFEARWPQLRAALIAFHVLMVVVMSLPAPDALLSGMGWDSVNTQAEVARWAEGLSRVGAETTPDALGASVRQGAERYRGFHTALTAPFSMYSQLSGARQGWVMFAKPQRHPAELHIDLWDGTAWQSVYRPHDSAHDFWGERLRHHRMRKQLGRFARTFDMPTYDRLAEFLAREVAMAHPEARRVRVQLYRYATLPPEAVRAGALPMGEYEHPRRYHAATLRAGAAP